MIVEVDAGDPTPVYEQIRSQVTLMVAAGTLPPGTRLPTIRQLAADLGLAKGTIARAYEALLRDGVVYSAGRNGTIVAEPAAADRSTDADLAQLTQLAHRFAVRARQGGLAPHEAAALVERAAAALDERTAAALGDAEAAPRP